MGAGVSGWRLAQAVSRLGQLGVVSGTALDEILVRRLQDGDPTGDIRRALGAFPFTEMAERIRDTYFIPGGKSPAASYRRLPMHACPEPRELVELCMIANFVEVFLAREGHTHPVGINYLEKIQLPHLPSFYGAMLAGVDYVLMGAGIPLQVPGTLDRLARHEPVEYPVKIAGEREGEQTSMHFDPREFLPLLPAKHPLKPLHRPRFLAIVSSATLASTLLRRSNGQVDGLVIELQTAGGHNAPPRGKLQLTEQGEPIYGERDAVDLARIRELGVPFWLAGGYASSTRLQEALSHGAAGIQVGTAFAFCRESGLRDDLKQRLLEKARRHEAQVFTDPLASPTGFPFKVARLQDTCSDKDIYEDRPRICDLGFLRELCRGEDGQIGYRCPAEPLSLYLKKGGKAEDAAGRKCLCNALMANIGHQQVRGRHVEPPLVTAGDDLTEIARFLPPEASDYTAADVLEALLARPAATA